MAEWLNDLVMSDVDGPPLGDRNLIEDLKFQDDDGKLWVTPAGTISDLSSFPAPLRMFIPKTEFAKSPWPHDYGYERQPEGITRKDWDEVYRQGCIAEMLERREDQPPPTDKDVENAEFIAGLLYRGLRLGGWVSWLRHRRKIRKGTARPLVEV